MATERDRPYSAFRYLVDLGGGTDGPRAGFQEVSGLGVEITMQEYRAGNDVRNAPIKIPGIYKVTDVSLKRGVLGALDLTNWLDQVRNGEDARRNITIQLQSEDLSTIAMTWRLEGAQPMKYTGPSLNGKGTDVAIEELGLCIENLTFE
ncbi:MAG: phage tail protein [Cyanobacteria bacterium P01_D01_bin.156]